MRTAPTVTVSGLITAVQRKITKRGDAWPTVTLEDLEGAIDVLLFPSAYQLPARCSPRTPSSPSRAAYPGRTTGDARPGGVRPDLAEVLGRW